MQLISIRIQLETNIKGDETSRTEAHDCPAGAFRDAPCRTPKAVPSPVAMQLFRNRKTLFWEVVRIQAFYYHLFLSHFSKGKQNST